MSRNFEVGDIVINIDTFQLWDNVYHHEKTWHCMRPETVVVANDTYFSTRNVDQEALDRLSSFSDHDVRRYAYSQKNGRQYDSYNGSDAMVNITRNTAGMLAFVGKEFTDRFAKCDEQDLSEIKQCEAEIASLQARIQRIKDGKRPISFKPEIIEREFLEKSRDTILAIIEGATQ